MLSRRSFALAGAASLATACHKKRLPGFDGYAFVANEAGNAVAAVDLTTFTVARHIHLGESPTAIVADPQNPRILVLTPRNGKIFEIDTTKLAVSRTLTVGPSLQMRLMGRSLWILRDRELTEVQVDPLKPRTRIGLPVSATDFDLSNYTNLAAIGHGSAGKVSIIDLGKGTIGATTQVSDAIGAVRFRLDGKGVLACDVANRRLCVLDGAAHVIANLPLSLRPDNLCFKDDGGQLFITGEGHDAVVVVFPYFVPQIAETVLAGHAPGPMAASPTHLFITNPDAGHVSIMNIARRKIEAVTSVGADPSFVTITPDNNYALVLNRQSGDMAVIKTAAVVPNNRKSVALFTMIPVGSRPVSAAIKSV